MRKKGGGGVVKKAEDKDDVINDQMVQRDVNYFLGYYSQFSDNEAKRQYKKAKELAISGRYFGIDEHAAFRNLGKDAALAAIAVNNKSQQSQQNKKYTDLKNYNDAVRRQLLSYSKESLGSSAGWNTPSFGFNTDIYGQFIEYQNGLTDSLNQFKFGTGYSKAEKDNPQFKALFARVENETLVYLKSFLEFYYGLSTAGNKNISDKAKSDEINSNQTVDTPLQEDYNNMMSTQRRLDDGRRSGLYDPKDIAIQQAAANRAYKRWQENKKRQSLPIQDLPFQSLPYQKLPSKF